MNNNRETSIEAERMLEQAVEEILSTSGTTDTIEILTNQVTPTNQIIPPNPESILVSEETSRFSSAIWFEEIQKQNVILAGLGGIGSYVAYLLSRLQIGNLHLFDGDIVESANMSGQMYGHSVIGCNKTTACANNLLEFSSFYRYNLLSRYTESSIAGPIMICGFDNMQARKTFFNRWEDYCNNASRLDNLLFIDGRLAAEEFQIFCIKGNDFYHRNLYRERFLFSDREAEQTICSYKQTTHCANMIASFMVNLFVNHIANQCNPLMERPVPFYTMYDSERMFFKTDDML